MNADKSLIQSISLKIILVALEDNSFLKGLALVVEVALGFDNLPVLLYFDNLELEVRGHDEEEIRFLRVAAPESFEDLYIRKYSDIKQVGNLVFILQLVESNLVIMAGDQAFF